MTGRRHRHRRALVRALGLLLLAQSLAAVRADAQTLFLAQPDRNEVAVGQAFVVRAEVLATAPGNGSALERRVTDAIRGMAWAQAPQGAVVVRRFGSQTTREDVEGAPVVRASMRWVLRADAPGTVTLPPLRVVLGRDTLEARVGDVSVFTPGVPLDSLRRAVLPLIAEVDGLRPGQRLRRSGSAFVVAPDVVLTSHHVVVGAHALWLVLPDGRRRRVRRVWAIDAENDLAALYLDPRVGRRAGVLPLAMAPPEAPEEGVVFTLGWPGGQQAESVGRHVAGAALGPGRMWISTNAVRPGDSGGPLLDRRGRVLGVVVSGTYRRDRDELDETMAVAVDPRPLLHTRLVARRPVRLRRAMADRLRHDPTAALAHLASDLRQARVGDRDLLLERLDALERRMHERSPDAGALFQRAGIRLVLGRLEEAEADYRSVLASVPEHFPAAYVLARHHLEGGQTELAQRLFERARRSPALRLAATYGLAQVLVERRRHAEAAEMLLELLRAEPAFAPGWASLGRVYLARGDVARARLALSQLDRLDGARAAALRRAWHLPGLRPFALRALPRAPLALPPVYVTPPQAP